MSPGRGQSEDSRQKAGGGTVQGWPLAPSCHVALSLSLLTPIMGIKTKKQRKVSKVTVSKGESAGSGEETLISGPGDRDTETAGDNVISMESMVTLPDPALSPLYVDAITKLKAGRYMEAVERLLRVIR